MSGKVVQLHPNAGHERDKFDCNTLLDEITTIQRTGRLSALVLVAEMTDGERITAIMGNPDCAVPAALSAINDLSSAALQAANISFRKTM